MRGQDVTVIIDRWTEARLRRETRSDQAFFCWDVLSSFLTISSLAFVGRSAEVAGSVEGEVAEVDEPAYLE